MVEVYLKRKNKNFPIELFFGFERSFTTVDDNYLTVTTRSPKKRRVNNYERTLEWLATSGFFGLSNTTVQTLPTSTVNSVVLSHLYANAIRDRVRSKFPRSATDRRCFRVRFTLIGTHCRPSISFDGFGSYNLNMEYATMMAINLVRLS